MLGLGTYLFYKFFIINIVFDDLWATMDTKFEVTYKIWKWFF